MTLELLGSQNEQKQYLSEFKDPFKSDKIEKIWISIRRGFFSDSRDKIEYSASIEFKNGNTEGKQNVEADNFPTLIYKIQEFIKSL